MNEFCYSHPRAGITGDVVLLLRDGDRTKILLVQRKFDPYKGLWATPGGFIEMDETLEEAARRELLEETGLTVDHLVFVGMYDAVDRDPRGRTLTAAFVGFATPDQAAQAKAADDAAAVQWFDLDHLPDLAFDHAQVIADARVKMGLSV